MKWVRLVQSLSGVPQCQPYLVGAEGWSWPWPEQRSGQSQPTGGGFGAVWSCRGAGVLVAVCLRKGRVLRAGLGIKVLPTLFGVQLGFGDGSAQHAHRLARAADPGSRRVG